MRTQRFLSLVITAFLAAGCTTLQPLETDGTAGADPGRVAMMVQPGDHVEVVTTDGRVLDLRVVSVSEEGLAARPWEIGGSADMGATMLVSLDEIGSISRYEVDGKRALINLGKSAGIVVGGAILLGAILIVAVALAL